MTANSLPMISIALTISIQQIRIMIPTQRTKMTSHLPLNHQIETSETSKTMTETTMKNKTMKTPTMKNRAIPVQLSITDSSHHQSILPHSS